MNVSTSDLASPSFRRWLALALRTGGSAVLVVLLARTAVGATDAQPGPWLIATLTAAAFAISMTVWRLADADRAPHECQPRITRVAAAWLAALLFGLLIARDSAAGIAAVAVVSLTWAVAAACYVLRSAERGNVSTSSPLHDANVDVVPLAGSACHAPFVPRCDPNETVSRSREPDASASDTDNSALRLHLRRSATPDGETIEVQARLEFAAGAREAVLHVPFWPALESQPLVECEPLDADDVEVRFTSVERYGLRLEARLPSATAAARSVLIGVEVRAAAATGGLSAAA